MSPSSDSTPETTSVNAVICVSVVSHGHGQQVIGLVEQLLREPLVGKIVLTLNIAEDLDLPTSERLAIVTNAQPNGFGANHNAAFKHCDLPFYCVLNPDVVINDGAIASLVSCLEQTKAAVVAPLVTDSEGQQEDSWRRFPTVLGLALKLVGQDPTIITRSASAEPISVDWVAGMCMLFQSDSYRLVKGFDERYFLYYEDVDLCARLWRAGKAVMACPEASVVHHAQRASHRQWRYMRWHLSSMIRYLMRYQFNSPRIAR